MTEEIKYGYQSNGEYLTPFNCTIFYHEDSMFETAAAVLASRAQVIKITKDCSSIANLCEYITPEVLIFGDEFSNEEIQLFFTKGFKFIHIFVYDNNTDSKISVENTAKFTIDTFYDHIVLIEGLSAFITMEHVIMGSFPNYKTIGTISHDDGKCFLNYIRNTSKLEETLVEIISSYHGFELINNMVIGGRAFALSRELLADKRIQQGEIFNLDQLQYKTMLLYNGDLNDELLALLPVHPSVIKNNVKYVVFHTSAKSKKIQLFRVGNDVPSSLSILESLNCNNIFGDFSFATGTFEGDFERLN
jgi:hypothetical protein